MILHFSHVCVLGFMSFLSLEFFFSFSYVHVQVQVFVSYFSFHFMFRFSFVQHGHSLICMYFHLDVHVQVQTVVNFWSSVLVNFFCVSFFQCQFISCLGLGSSLLVLVFYYFMLCCHFIYVQCLGSTFVLFKFSLVFSLRLGSVLVDCISFSFSYVVLCKMNALLLIMLSHLKQMIFADPEAQIDKGI